MQVESEQAKAVKAQPAVRPAAWAPANDELALHALVRRHALRMPQVLMSIVGPGISARSSVTGMSCRSTVLSVVVPQVRFQDRSSASLFTSQELEIERERRQARLFRNWLSRSVGKVLRMEAAERELEELRKKLDSMNVAGSQASTVCSVFASGCHQACSHRRPAVGLLGAVRCQSQ